MIHCNSRSNDCAAYSASLPSEGPGCAADGIRFPPQGQAWNTQALEYVLIPQRHHRQHDLPRIGVLLYSLCINICINFRVVTRSPSPLTLAIRRGHQERPHTEASGSMVVDLSLTNGT
jgi:hypothetical protein